MAEMNRRISFKCGECGNKENFDFYSITFPKKNEDFFLEYKGYDFRDSIEVKILQYLIKYQGGQIKSSNNKQPFFCPTCKVLYEHYPIEWKYGVHIYYRAPYYCDLCEGYLFKVPKEMFDKIPRINCKSCKGRLKETEIKIIKNGWD
ncbi:MAG: hypothetical protein K9L74_04625 [Candidatus Izimaplasma sp.]|nr:hypothetical protein [Candidatus Izimaplasma bacterium]